MDKKRILNKLSSLNRLDKYDLLTPEKIKIIRKPIKVNNKNQNNKNQNKNNQNNNNQNNNNQNKIIKIIIKIIIIKIIIKIIIIKIIIKIIKVKIKLKKLKKIKILK